MKITLIAENGLDFSPDCLHISNVRGVPGLLVSGYGRAGVNPTHLFGESRDSFHIYSLNGALIYAADKPPARIHFVSVSSDQKMIIVGGRGGVIKINASTLNCEYILRAIDERFYNISFSPRSSVALLKGGAGVIWKMDLEINELLPLWEVSEDSGNIVIHPDGDHFVLVENYEGGTFLVFSSLGKFENGDTVELEYQANYVSSMAFNHTGDLFAFTLDHLYLFYYPSLEPVLRIEKSGKISEEFSMENLGESEVWTDIIFSQDDRFLYFGNNVDGEIIRVDLINKSSEVLVKTHKDAIRKIAMSVDDSIMAAIGIDSTLRVWRMETD